MTDMITITGFVATVPRHLVTNEGLSITSFRLASTQRRFDRSQDKWVDGDTNWYTVTTFRQLALNVSTSVNKGERIVVTGRLRIRDWTTGEKTGTTIEIDAEALGHDLGWGTATFSRSMSGVVSDVPMATDASADPPAPDSSLSDAAVDPSVLRRDPLDTPSIDADGWASPMGSRESESVPF